MSDIYRIGVDIGGTFTDLVLINENSGEIRNEKVLTTPEDPSAGVLHGVEKIMQTNGVDPSQVQHIIHGTTLVANAIIERRGVKVALITTEGFGDVQEIGTELRYDTYDLFMELPEPIVPRKWRYEAPERVGPSGEILTPLDEDAVLNIVTEILATDVEAVAISLLHSYLNPVHEQRIRAILEERAPNLIVCASSDVMPEIGEYERTSTAICNAYVLPIFKRYLKRLTDGLKERGINRDLYLMLSDGGTVHESTAAAYPIRLVQSGPAGGVQASAAINRIVCRGEVEGDILCFDMGGTTAKACLIEKGLPMHANDFEVARVYRCKKGSGIPLKVPVIDMIEIGAGGGSIAHLDNLGLIQVGPESSSAFPGPACYGRGGKRPTVTDADLVLGYLAFDNFLGGDMVLDIEASKESIREAIAEPLGISVTDAAWAIHDTVNESMAQAAAIHALEKAKRITDYAMIPIGGAGPVHACNIGLKLSLPRIICPPGAGVASALGFLVSPTSFTFLQGGVIALDSLDFDAVRRRLDVLERRGRDLILEAGEDPESIVAKVLSSMRYVGQGYDVEVPISLDMLGKADVQQIREQFERIYASQFGRIEPSMEVEVVSWRVTTTGKTPDIDIVAGRNNSEFGDSDKGHRHIYFGPADGFVEVPVFDRYRVAPGTEFHGAAIFEERESTIVVPPGSFSVIDDALNLIIDLPVPKEAAIK